jgi:hypothetical protein
MTEPEEFVYERVDDIPLLLALMIKMQVSVILDKHLGNHGHQQGLTNGCVSCIWLALSRIYTYLIYCALMARFIPLL